MANAQVRPASSKLGSKQRDLAQFGPDLAQFGPDLAQFGPELAQFGPDSDQFKKQSQLFAGSPSSSFSRSSLQNRAAERLQEEAGEQASNPRFA